MAKIGKPDNVRPGEWVVAIGAPFGFENSVMAGVVGAKGRLMSNESYVPFIQTDVGANPGNSGGQLFNMNGEAVGINSMIYSQTGGYMGLAFAIPIDIAFNVAEQLRGQGKVSRSRIGVQVQELSRGLTVSFGLKDAQGTLVANVARGGPADKAGVPIARLIYRITILPKWTRDTVTNHLVVLHQKNAHRFMPAWPIAEHASQRRTWLPTRLNLTGNQLLLQLIRIEANSSKNPMRLLTSAIFAPGLNRATGSRKPSLS